MSVVEKIEQHRVTGPGILGASDAGAALGLDPYRRPIQVWRELRGLPVDDARPEGVREAAEWGLALEPVVRGKYALDRGVIVMVPEESFVAGCGWVRATPDGLVADAAPGRARTVSMREIPMAHDVAKGLVQVKTCSREAWRAWQEQPPAHHIAQCLVEMAVCDLPWDDLAYLVGGQHMHVVRVERDIHREHEVMETLRQFVLRAKEGREPDVDDSEAWRQHASEKMRKGNVSVRADAGSGLRDLLDAWKMYRSVRKKYEADEERVKNEILLALSAAGATAIEADELGRVTAYQTGGRADWKAYAQSFGAGEKVPERFVKPSSTWALRAPKEWSSDAE